MRSLTLTDSVEISLCDLVNLYRNVYELWVFGYGSILWKPGFTYKQREVGKISGYVRRFWQGNVTHRGTPEYPGRVATLVSDAQGEVWGMSFQLVGRTMIKKGLHHLGVRECALGGYTANVVPFESLGRGGVGRSPGDVSPPCEGPRRRRYVLVFTAPPNNPYYMGPAPLDAMAQEIVGCVGRTGHNVEYVTRLADFVRRHIPEDQDQHLFQLDFHLREILRQNQDWLQRVLRSVRRKDSRPLRVSILEPSSSHDNSSNFVSPPTSPTPRDAATSTTPPALSTPVTIGPPATTALPVGHTGQAAS